VPATFFGWLADSGLHHVNVSIESRDPAIYERLRKGARHPIFLANWEALLAAQPAGRAAPRLRYIAMAYRSNLRELPDLTAYLLTERQAHQVEVRYTYDVPHIPHAFKEAEYLSAADWRWLRDALAEHPADRVLLVAPPAEAPVPVPAAGAPAAPEQAGPVLPGHYMFQLGWDGTLRVTGTLAASREGRTREVHLRATDVRTIDDPLRFFDRLDNDR
jgi:hypothetical protein